MLEGKAWEPVRPKSVTRAVAVVTVTMHVPAPPVVLDTTLVTDPGKFGFEWTDDGPTTPTITSVASSGDDTVVVTQRLQALQLGRALRGRCAVAQRFGGVNPGGTPGR